MDKTITITMCDVAENHAGMQKIGYKTNKGFSLDQLKCIQEAFPKISELIDISYKDNPAYLLVLRGGIDKFVDSKELFSELLDLDWDKKAYMRGRVVNKHARYNLCFAENDQEPNYEEKMGRVVAWKSAPLLGEFKEKLSKIFDIPLVAEGNYYYNLKKTYISYHGDRERNIVIGCRLGATMNLKFQWYLWSKPVSDEIEIILNHGDMYFMDDKCTGKDWLKKKIYTVRHGANI